MVRMDVLNDALKSIVNAERLDIYLIMCRQGRK